MDRRRFLAAAISTSALSLAGCSDFIDSDRNVNFSYSDGYSESGVTDAMLAVGSHRNATLASRSYRLNYTVRASIDGTEQQSVRQRRDVDTREELREKTGDGYHTVQYMAGDHAYMRRSEDGADEPTFTAVSDTSFQETTDESLHVQELERYLRSIDFRLDDISTSRDGNLIATYRVKHLADPEPILGNSPDTQAETLDATLKVDTEGRIHLFDIELVLAHGDDSPDIDLTIAFSGHNATTVEQPDWLDAAVANEGADDETPEPTESHDSRARTEMVVTSLP